MKSNYFYILILTLSIKCEERIFYFFEIITLVLFTEKLKFLKDLENFFYLAQRRIQNPVNHLRWSDLRKYVTALSR